MSENVDKKSKSEREAELVREVCRLLEEAAVAGRDFLLYNGSPSQRQEFIAKVRSVRAALNGHVMWSFIEPLTERPGRVYDPINDD